MPTIPAIGTLGFSARVTWLTIGLVSGCASTPRAPAELDLGRSVIVGDPAPPALVINGPSGKGAAAGTGAAKGAGTGLGVGTVACLGTGIFFPLCVAAVVPTSMAVGAVGWAAVSASNAESAEAVEQQRGLLSRELATLPYPARLAEQLQETARSRLAIELPMAGPTGVDDSRWIIETALTELVSEAHGEGKPYALRFEGRLRLRRSTQAEPVYERTIEVTTETALTTADWAADDGAALHAALAQVLRSMAEQLLSGLTGAPLPAPRGVTRS
jgi:hypothetical protein